jgi:hypothetical protein
MTDDVALLNDALSLLAEPALINAAAAKTPLEREVVRLAPAVKRELLAKQRWTCATRYDIPVDPDADADAPTPFGFVGVLPADFLALWDADADAFSLLPDRRIAWSRVQRLRIVYAADVAYDLLDPLLQYALAARLAWRCAGHKAKVGADYVRMKREASTQAEIDAATRDALNRREEPLLSSHWIAPSLERWPE